MEQLRLKGSFLKSYRFWYLAENEYPHDDRGEVQLVLRQHNNVPQNNLVAEEMRKIRIRYQHLNFLNNGTLEKSVLYREHMHFYNFKKADEERD